MMSDIEADWRRQLTDTIKSLGAGIKELNTNLIELRKDVNTLDVGVKLMENELKDRSQEKQENKARDALIGKLSTELALIKQRVYIITGIGTIVGSGIVTAIISYVAG